jgi:transcriptional regulator with XRE-family HTH domain
MVAEQNRVRELRRARNLTQERLADLSGVDQATISKLENDLLDNPLYRTLANLARVLGVPTDALMIAPPAPHDKRAAERRTGIPRRPAERRTGIDRRGR